MTGRGEKMAQIDILPLGESDGLDEALIMSFGLMYCDFERSAPILGLIEGGERIWLDGLKKGLGRMRQCHVAQRGSDLVGFIDVSIAVGPSYLGEPLIGRVNHVFVDPTSRQQKIGQRLFRKARAWLISRNVEVCQLQVVEGNSGALAFWRRLGFSNELQQMTQRFVK